MRRNLRRSGLICVSLAALLLPSAAHACLTHDAASLANCVCPEVSTSAVHASQHTSQHAMETLASQTFASQAFATKPQRNVSETFAASFASAQGPSAGSTVVVHVFNTDFSTNPSSGPVVDPVISVGDTIQWVWDDGFHSVTSVTGSAESFNSGDQFGPGPTFSHTFTNAGTFTYFCDIHGFQSGGQVFGMSGTVTVRAIPEPTVAALFVAAIGYTRRVRRR